MKWPLTLLRHLARTALLLSLVAAGTILLMRFAPGYFSDAREMDAKYVGSAQAQLNEERANGSIAAIARTTFGNWMHGDLGRSRQYEVPVWELIAPRVRVTASLLARGVAYGWLLALGVALPLSAARTPSALLAAPFTILLAVPTGALATFCLLSGTGGPVLVLVLLLASRDFKFLYRALRGAWSAPHLLTARAHGQRLHRLAWVHVLPNVWPQITALATLSLVTALSAIVPVEVIFDQPGLGSLAWTAAMNRDLPVLMATTMLMAAAVALASAFSGKAQSEAIA